LDGIVRLVVKMTKKPTRLSLRIDLPDGSRLGPGKATELIEKYQGGSSRGGAALTEAGKSVLGIYRNIEAESAKAAVLSLKKLRKMTRS